MVGTAGGTACTSATHAFCPPCRTCIHCHAQSLAHGPSHAAPQPQELGRSRMAAQKRLPANAGLFTGAFLRTVALRWPLLALITAAVPRACPQLAVYTAPTSQPTPHRCSIAVVLCGALQGRGAVGTLLVGCKGAARRAGRTGQLKVRGGTGRQARCRRRGQGSAGCRGRSRERSVRVDIVAGWLCARACGRLHAGRVAGASRLVFGAAAAL